MRFISADYIFPVSSPPINNGVIAVRDDGLIEDILTPQGFEQLQTSNLKPETYNGIICPGFINSHCHLELSHLKGKFPEGKGLPHFIGDVITKREAKKEIVSDAIAKAEEEMIFSGIVAVGDICNGTDTIEQKKKKRLLYHNFIEVFDLHSDRAEIEFEKGEKLLNEFEKVSHSSSITPHAPYSVSQRLFRLINEFNTKSGGFISIHNEETESENEMFLHRTGALFEKLSSFGNLYNDWKCTGTNSLNYILKNIYNLKTLLVHNTCTGKSDLDLITTNFYCCFCPNANLFIENRLPDFNLFLNSKLKIVLGTDSYASNWSLSILDEMKTIQKNASQIKLEDLIKWATLNGAEFFNWDKDLGSIEKGKKPGLNLITNISMNEVGISLTDQSQVKPLLN